jgi:hypothetical protein
MIVAVIALVVGAAGGALAGRGGHHGVFLDSGVAAKGFVGTTVAFQANSTSLVPIPGATVRLKVPSGRKGLVVATFNATSQCTGGGQCNVVIKVDGHAATPKNQGAFDTTGAHPPGDYGAQAHSMTVDRKVGSGRHRVKAFYVAPFAPAQIALDSWHLFAQAVPR